MKKGAIVWSGTGLLLILTLVLAVGCSNATPAATTATVAVADEAACCECHNATTKLVAAQVQYEASVHGTGLTFERNSADCANCHTSEGFTERVAAQTYEISGDIENPSPVNCRTCHEIHTTYTGADWALAVTEPFDLEINGVTVDMGKGTLCASCHQPRTAAIPEAGGGEYKITSTRFGPHHGPQSSMIIGTGEYGDYEGAAPHYMAIEDGCVNCHMSSAFGKQSGGHTMNMAYDYHGSIVPNLSACTSCHEGIESFDYRGLQTEIEELVEEARALLVAQGLITESGSGVAGTFTSEQAGALWNFKTVEEDRSGGVHNPPFAKYLLETAIEALQ